MAAHTQDQEREFVPKWRRNEARIVQAIDLRRQQSASQGSNTVETWQVWQAEALQIASSQAQTD